METKMFVDTTTDATRKLMLTKKRKFNEIEDN